MTAEFRPLDEGFVGEVEPAEVFELGGERGEFDAGLGPDRLGGESGAGGVKVAGEC